MDKLKMTITLSPESEPELLNYLNRISGPRERAFVLRLLAVRGLQALAGAGPEALLQVPAYSHFAPVLPAMMASGGAEMADSGTRTEQVDQSPPQALIPVQPIVQPTPAQPLPVSPAPVERGASGVLANLNIEDLNSAMARFG